MISLATFDGLYNAWVGRVRPSETTARMVRSGLKYVARAARAEDWRQMPVMPETHALALLEVAMAQKTLAAQSRCNYRNYLRRLYRFADDHGINLGGAGTNGFWPAAPNHDAVPRRAQNAYERFTRWAIASDLWPNAARADDVRRWADAERPTNRHWRKDYSRLQAAWLVLSESGELPALNFPELPPPITSKYALPVDQWPVSLRDEWQKMCRAAAAPLREGGPRQWREVTRDAYEGRLTRFVGWFALEHPEISLATLKWADLLALDNVRAYLNWLVARSGASAINPGHTGFLRMARGFHRFLLKSPVEVVGAFTDLAKRAEVEERDKATRMAPYPDLLAAFRKLLAECTAVPLSPKSAKDKTQRATIQVNTIILGLLVTRALRVRNIRELAVGTNLVPTADGFGLTYAAKDMKGHRKFEVTLPAELVPVVREYQASGYKALVGRAPGAGDKLLVTRDGTPFELGALAARVRALGRRYIGKELHPHIYRHILATHAAQVLRMTPTELAALLAHKSVLTVMRYYEVTSPALAAARLDALCREAG